MRVSDSYRVAYLDGQGKMTSAVLRVNITGAFEAREFPKNICAASAWIDYSDGETAHGIVEYQTPSADEHQRFEYRLLADNKRMVKMLFSAEGNRIYGRLILPPNTRPYPDRPFAGWSLSAE